MDDEQGPWWTRPPEPAPQAPPIPAPAIQRRRADGQQDVDVEYPTEVAFVPPAAYPPADFAPSAYPSYPRPEPIAPEPEPAPPPVPKPVVRRVAVVPPAAPPVRTGGADPRDERTETLPAVGDGIFATFSGPLPVDSPPSRAGSGRSAPPGDGTGEPADRSAAAGLLDRLPHVTMPEPRVLLLAAAAALVVLLIVIVALLSGRGPAPTSTAGTPAPGPTSAEANPLPGQNPDGLTQLGASAAIAELSKAGQGPGGSIVEAWAWNDKNGRNLVVTSVDRVGANKRTLRVVHVAGLNDDPRTLRVMRDPGLPAGCPGAGVAGFTPKTLIVRDLNQDDVAEVISGWTSRCGGRGAQSQIRLALITDGDKFILRGQGVLGGTGTFTPDPRAARWPDVYLDTVKGQYRKVYG